MQAIELIITAKVNKDPFAIVSLDNFQLQSGRPVDPRIVLEAPNVSLYCVEHQKRRAIFVETSPDIELTKAPFYFIAQYEAAQRLIAVPYETLLTLANEASFEAQKVILFYSTGRCGSTLFSHVLNLNPSVVSYSEPDVFSQLVHIRTAGQSDDKEVGDLLKACVTLMSANASRQGYAYAAFKFRSYILAVSDLLFQVLPDAKLLFMYRNALTWARSFSRAFGAPTDMALEQHLIGNGFRYMVPNVHARLQTNDEMMGWVEYTAHLWVSTMQDARWLQTAGAPLATASFEDMQTDPHTAFRALLAHCELPMPPQDALSAILAKDSQAGTEGAQSKKKPARSLSAADLEALDRTIRQMDPTLSPDTRFS